MSDGHRPDHPHASLMPSWLPRLNRRVVNPVQRLWAPYLPPLAMVGHRGRRSGRHHENPVLAFRGGDTVAIPLVYGSETEWVRNVRAAGGGELRRGGRRFRLSNPRIATDPQTAGLPPVARRAIGKVPFLLADLDGD